MWTTSRSGPADEPPTPEQLQQWYRRMSPPENEFPDGLGLTLLLGRGDDVAVGITQVEAFSTGFRFALSVRLRRPRPELHSGRLFMLTSSRVPPHVEIPLAERPHRRHRYRARPPDGSPNRPADGRSLTPGRWPIRAPAWPPGRNAKK